MPTLTWNGNGADNLASTGGNWSGGSAPAAGDTVVFDGVAAPNGSKNCTWDVTTALNVMTLSSGYTGTFTASAAVNINSGVSQTLTFNSAGTFDSAGQAVTIGAGGFDASGAATKTLTMGASVWTVTGTFDISGANLTFNANTSEVKFGLHLTVNAGGKTFYKLTHTAEGGTITGPVTITNTFDITTKNTAAGTYTAGTGGKFYAQGNVQMSSTGGYMDASSDMILEFSGSANQTYSVTSNVYGNGLNIVINKSGNTLTFSGTILCYPVTWVYTAGTVDPGTSTVKMSGYSPSHTINSGSQTFNNLTIWTEQSGTGTVTLASNLLVTGNLAIDTDNSVGASITFAASSYTVTVNGNWTRNVSQGVFTQGTSTVIFNGTSTLAGGTTFNNLTINAAKTVHLTSTQTFTVAGAFTANGSVGNLITLDATTGGSRANLPVNGSQSTSYVTATDIDSSGGSVVPITNSNGTNTNTVSWGSAAASKVRKMMLMGVS